MSALIIPDFFFSIDLPGTIIVQMKRKNHTGIVRLRFTVQHIQAI